MSLRLAALALLLSGGAACTEGDVVAEAGSAGPSLDLPAEDARDFGPLPDFHLVSERGTSVALADLGRRPLVFAALYSTCTGPCPSIASTLAELQQELSDTDVLLVTVTVDPEIDTPAVLAGYAHAKGADPERWTFLTGTRDEVYAFVRSGLFLPVDQRVGAPPGERVTHDTRLLVVDRQGLRRGWYEGKDAGQVQKLKKRVRHLAAEGR